ncbi:arsenate reductase (glutaredoxin) [Pseudogemmobacter humi]|uniref:Arsenate reductase n=1 Tax=Pseudogemmobacter humi TaxID=2483812 RepID=A0A3P5X2A1_9RHOB|nr:arsenate reductase (glutaredoxin) [Pseudogemmobacter humi]VDC28047.1 Arsenate reductase [Pseudogemmobacter humi]
MSARIYHNPGCGTSRNVLAVLRAAGPVEVVDYLKAGWSADQLRALFAAAGVTPRQALRVKGTPAAELVLTDPAVSDEAILAAMVAHPVLVERPFVTTPKGARLCRPSGRVLELLETPPPGVTVKADGSAVLEAP